MISYPRSDTSSENPEPPSVRIIGLGNAGAQLADRLQMNGHADVVVMNTDTQSLLSSIVAKKVALGQKTTYGLGAGGDPEVGYDAAQESRNDIRSAVEGANIIFLCAGLGGGTASGVIPILAQTARETGAVVFSIVTSPFSFEGRRRSKQPLRPSLFCPNIPTRLSILRTTGWPISHRRARASRRPLPLRTPCFAHALAR